MLLEPTIHPIINCRSNKSDPLTPSLSFPGIDSRVRDPLPRKKRVGVTSSGLRQYVGVGPLFPNDPTDPLYPRPLRLGPFEGGLVLFGEEEVIGPFTL